MNKCLCCLLQVVLIYVTAIDSRRQRYCNARNNWYYRESIKQCYKCEKCVVGEGKIRFEDANLPTHPPYGATQCIPCRPCGAGTYSEKRAFKCKHCRDCNQQARYELRKCTNTQNAVCGDKIQETSTQKTLALCQGNSCNGNHLTTIALLNNGSIPSNYIKNDSTSEAVIITVSAFSIVMTCVAAVLCFQKRKKACCFKDKQRRRDVHRNGNQHIPLMTVRPDRIQNNESSTTNSQNEPRLPPRLPKMSNLDETDRGQCRRQSQSQTIDSDETNMKETGLSSPTQTVMHHAWTARNQNQSQNRNKKQANVNNFANRHCAKSDLFGEINKACRENSSGSDISTLPKRDLYSVRQDVSDSSGSLLPFRSLSDFAYTFTAPNLNRFDDVTSCQSRRPTNMLPLTSTV